MANLVDELQTVKLRNVSVSCFTSFVWIVYRFLIIVIANQVPVVLICKREWYLYTLIDHWFFLIEDATSWFQLERQLNAIYNREEEERIRKEEAAKEDRWHFVENSLHCLQAGWICCHQVVSDLVVSTVELFSSRDLRVIFPSGKNQVISRWYKSVRWERILKWKKYLQENYSSFIWRRIAVSWVKYTGLIWKVHTNVEPCCVLVSLLEALVIISARI